MKYIITLLATMFISNIFGQDTLHQKIKYSFMTTQFGINVNENELFLALGGPGISYSNTKTEFSLRFLASLRFETRKNLLKPNESIRPLMGFGTQFRYKQFIITPSAFYFYNGKWEYASGIGYLISNKKHNK